MTRTSRIHIGAAIAAALLSLAWDATGLDMSLASTLGTPAGFPLKENWVLSRVFHEWARDLSVLVWLASCVFVRWPMGPWRQFDRSRRLQFAVTAGVAALLVSVLKSLSLASCPWDMAEFGGAAHHISHWAMQHDGGPGRCFPSGHASSGFVYFAGYFAFLHARPRIAFTWLAIACITGLGLGFVQQLRGAHFMSHTLWTGWVCWTAALLIDLAWRRPAAGRTTA